MNLTYFFIILANFVVKIKQNESNLTYFCVQELCMLNMWPMGQVKFRHIPQNTRILMTTTQNQNNNYKSLFLGSNLKQINNYNLSWFRKCSKRDTFEETVGEMTYSMFSKSIWFKQHHAGGFDECLKVYCLGIIRGLFVQTSF